MITISDREPLVTSCIGQLYSTPSLVVFRRVFPANINNLIGIGASSEIALMA